MFAVAIDVEQRTFRRGSELGSDSNMIDHRSQGLEVVYLGFPCSHGAIASPTDFDSLNVLRFNMGTDCVPVHLELIPR